jgi:Na+/proline symporter
MIYRVINPTLADPNAAYPMMVAAVVPAGLRGLVAAALISAIMSTISGLVNSTSTMVTLDIIQRGKGKNWPEEKLVRVGRWSGAIALLLGALFAPVVMKWDIIFRYAQDLWAPMAAPVVVVFMAGALWKGAEEKGALLCLWLSILTVPFTLMKSILADGGIHFLPPNLENPMVFAGAVGLVSLVIMLFFTKRHSIGDSLLSTGIATAAILWIATDSPAAIALLILILMAALIAILGFMRRSPLENLWDVSMLRSGAVSWYRSLWLWWGGMAITLGMIYFIFW